MLCEVTLSYILQNNQYLMLYTQRQTDEKLQKVVNVKAEVKGAKVF